MNAPRSARDALRVVLAAGLFVAFGATGHAAPAPGLARPEGASGTVVIPDRFLRRWDPVTVFFGSDTGPAGGPEDRPARFVRMRPEHPGAWTWIDARTLQFRPAEPWPPLERFEFTAGGRSTRLTTLMPPPTRTLPRPGSTGLDPVEAVTLTFPAPLDPSALQRMVRIELRPLPGIGPEGAQWLDADDFEIKSMERKSRNEGATYVVGLHHPVPHGTRAIVHLRLSLEDDAAESFAQVSFATAEPFRVVRLGCRGSRYPVTPEGTRYTSDQALDCGDSDSVVVVEFSAVPRNLGPMEGRNLVRITPPVDGLTYEVQGRELQVSGAFDRETVYAVALSPHPLTDTEGRALELTGASEVSVFFPRKSPFLRWGEGQGIVERYGPKRVPVEGRGFERVDLRVHPIDPLDRTFWPFPPSPVTVDESGRPPGPGEEPDPHTAAGRHVSASELTRHLQALGSPPISRIVSIPLRQEGAAASFGLDLAPHLEFLSKADAPGAYLVGLRRLDDSTERAWMRLQVTDLALTTYEEPRRVRFVVTSLSTGRPVRGARVRVEGARRSDWTTLVEGTTGRDGTYSWSPQESGASVRRIVVQDGNDVLVLDPTRPPETFANGSWTHDRNTWLQWTQGRLENREAKPETLCHIFTERPVYRPEEKVHVKGWLRRRFKGKLEPVRPQGFVVVDGPGNLQWRHKVRPDAEGGFYWAFDENELPTGAYSAHFETAKGRRYGYVSFRKEAYRLPRFEVRLHGPDEVPLDRPFDVSLTASYYAGGKVAGRPVQWRVTQFPHRWTPKARPGFVFSSDARFSGGGRFESTGRLDRPDVTDDAGGAKLNLNPAIEPTADPRSYVVEATVTGADDQTVTATRRVVALPPFVLGLKAPRYLEQAQRIPVQVAVVGHDGKDLAGQEVTVRLVHRQWHSYLQAGDFSDGVAKYVTDVVDEKLHEEKLTSGTGVAQVSLPIREAGVYVVELESRDRLGRAQTVSVDLYAGGEKPVSWARPPTRVFDVALDREKVAPGQTANFVLKSPFQEARVLAVVEAPEGNAYHWLTVKGGAATFELPVRGTWTPRVPVHFVLYRGRVQGSQPVPGTRTDLGKPTTLAATQWVEVEPVDNRVQVRLDHPDKAQPGDEVAVAVELKDPAGAPLSGVVTLWLVDQAVLALGQEQRLDPLPDFITRVRSRLGVHDTRNLVLGLLPLNEHPGGGEGEEARGEQSLLDKTTVRKNFQPVPFYDPSIRVGPSGRAVVKVKLPDNLTNFKIRAKAVSGPERFGHAGSQLAVRLPVIVQPALPRFVRPGDRFLASAIARVVEGEGGEGRAELRAEGVDVGGASNKRIALKANRPERVDFEVVVKDPPMDDEGRLAWDEVSFTLGVERTSDKARDAFQVKLPVRPDRTRVTVRALADLQPGGSVELPPVEGEPRPGTTRRSVLVSDQPALIRMAAGLDFLVEYPYGCTEQRVSQVRARIALGKFRELLHRPEERADLGRSVQELLEWIPETLDDQGLAAYWPGGRGYVSLTAWVVELLVEAKDAGFDVDRALMGKLTRALRQALRSDYRYFIDGEAWAERTFALSALASAGEFDADYAAELSRRAGYLDAEAAAEVLLAYDRSGVALPATTEALRRQLWEAVVFRLHQGGEIYGGLQATAGPRNGLIVPSETRSLATILRALQRTGTSTPRHEVLLAGLVTLGRGDGWGSTNANAEALLALSDVLQPPFAGARPHSVRLSVGSSDRTLSLGPDQPVGYHVTTSAAPGRLQLASGGGPVVARMETSWVPAGDGSQVAPDAQGFVVSREWLVVRGEDAPPERRPLEAPGQVLALAVGDVIEEHVQLVNPKDRHYVAVVVPLAAGMEPLNPSLATAPPEARPQGTLTLQPTYAAYQDDHVAYYFDTLPKGSYDFYFRTRASVPGAFVQPASRAEMMYDGAVQGRSAGARVQIAPKD